MMPVVTDPDSPHQTLEALGRIPVVLLVDDDAFTRLQLRHYLEQNQAYEVIEAEDGDQGLVAFQEHRPDIVLLDALMPGINGFDLCGHLRQLPDGRDTPILIITALDDQASVDQAFAAGAHDYITKPIQWTVLRHRLTQILNQFLLQQQLRTSNELLQQMATTDELTRVSNRRRFDAYLQQEWRRQMRNQAPLSLVMADIDEFKLYNDTFGHQAGDVCLYRVAQTIQQTLHRPADLLARYGGEEFVIVLPNTPASGVQTVVERVQHAIAQMSIAHSIEATSPLITLSYGLATLLPNMLTDPLDLIMEADKALYKAKKNGRNQAVQAEC